jgi:hypothetical protein
MNGCLPGIEDNGTQPNDEVLLHLRYNEVVSRRTAQMAILLTLADIKSRYAGEWVLVEAPQLGQSLEVLAGTVLFHSKDRDEVYRQAIALHPSRFAVLYTGTMPEGTAIVL